MSTAPTTRAVARAARRDLYADTIRSHAALLAAVPAHIYANLPSRPLELLDEAATGMVEVLADALTGKTADERENGQSDYAAVAEHIGYTETGPGLSFTRSQVEGWVGHRILDADLPRLAAALATSSFPDTVNTVAGESLALIDPDAAAEWKAELVAVLVRMGATGAKERVESETPEDTMQYAPDADGDAYAAALHIIGADLVALCDEAECEWRPLDVPERVLTAAVDLIGWEWLRDTSAAWLDWRNVGTDDADYPLDPARDEYARGLIELACDTLTVGTEYVGAVVEAMHRYGAARWGKYDTPAVTA